VFRVFRGSVSFVARIAVTSEVQNETTKHTKHTKQEEEHLCRYLLND